MSGGWAADLPAVRLEGSAVFDSRWGFTPWRAQSGQRMLLVMDIKTWIVEVEVAACISLGAIIVFTLMVGHTVLMSLARK
jgi:hypothetical protein